MNFSFSKKIINGEDFNNPFRKQLQSQYRVFDGERLAGEFIYTPKGCRFSYDDKKMRLDLKARFFRFPKGIIIDEGSEIEIGSIYMKSNRWVQFFPNIDKITLGSQVYKFRPVKPDVKFSLFKKHTWGYYKFSLTKEEEAIFYSFKIDFPREISLGNISPKLPFEGRIESRNHNMIALLAGFYLVEMALELDTID